MQINANQHLSTKILGVKKVFYSLPPIKLTAYLSIKQVTSYLSSKENFS